MKKCLLWGIGKCLADYVNVVKYHEKCNHFKVVGVTSLISIYSEIYGYRYVNRNVLHELEYDIVIILEYGQQLREAYDEIINIGIKDEYIFSYRILLQYNFAVEKYVNIKKNPPSIFANNCWGGITYRKLDLKFTSPLINMTENAVDYIKFLKTPQQYMNEKLELIEMHYDKAVCYPIVRCGDIKLSCNHYGSFEEVRECWERRKNRINWNNLFVMMYTEDRNLAKEFNSLPYIKKICFVPFETQEESMIYVKFRNVNEIATLPFWKIIIRMATDEYPYYDLFELIEHAKYVPIAEINN